MIGKRQVSRGRFAMNGSGRLSCGGATDDVPLRSEERNRHPLEKAARGFWYIARRARAFRATRLAGARAERASRAFTRVSMRIRARGVRSRAPCPGCGRASYLNDAGLFVLLRLHRERDARAGDAGGGLRERGDGLLEAEAGRFGRREGERGESVDERHRVRSECASPGDRRGFPRDAGRDYVLSALSDKKADARSEERPRKRGFARRNGPRFPFSRLETECSYAIMRAHSFAQVRSANPTGRLVVVTPRDA